MADAHVYFNPGPDSLVYDGQGHSVDGFDRVTTRPNPTTRALVSSGALVDQGPEDDGEPAEQVEVVVDDDEQQAANDESGD